MTTTTVGISAEVSELARLQEAAKQAGMSFSAYMVRAGRTQFLRDQATRYRRVMADLDTADKQGLEALRQRGVQGLAGLAR